MKLNGDSSNLSLEQVQKFNKTLSAIKDLPAQQEEIIKRVLQGETEIGELRLSFLEQHFDTYSKKLDEIVARKKSDLNDIFLILDSKLSSSYKKLSSDIDKIKEQLEDINTDSEDSGQQKSQKDTANANTKALVDTVTHMLADAYKQESTSRAKIIGSGNSELLALEKQFQEQRYVQLKQHLDNIVSITAGMSNIPAVKASDESVQMPGVEPSVEITEKSAVSSVIQDEASLLTDKLNEASTLLHEYRTADGDRVKTSTDSAVPQIDEAVKDSDLIEAIELGNKDISNSVSEVVQAVEQQQQVAATNEIDSLAKATSEAIDIAAELNKASAKDDVAAQEISNVANSADVLVGKADEINKSINDLAASSKQATSSEAITDYTDSEPHEYPDNITATIQSGQKIDFSDDSDIEQTAIEAEAATDNSTAATNEIEDDDLSKTLTEFIENLSRLKSYSFKDVDIESVPEGMRESFKKFLGELNQELEKQRKKSYDDITRTQEQINDIRSQMAKLELARSKEAQDVALRAKRLQLKASEEVLSAELKAQQLINEIESQLADISIEDANELSITRAEGVNANENYKAAEIINKQMADLKAQLDAEAMARNGGVLSVADAADNDQIIRDHFADYEDRIASIKAENAAKTVEDPKVVEANEKKRAALIAKLERDYKKNNNGILDALAKKSIEEQADRELELRGKNLEKLRKDQAKADKANQKEKEKAEREAHKKKTESAVTHPLSKEDNLLDRFKELKKASDEKSHNGAGLEKAVAALDTAIVAVSSMLAQLDKTIDDIASYKGDIDTRLQGSKNEQSSGSYWSQLTKDMMSVGAVTPYFKQEDFAKNIKSLVDQGISFDLKQRAFLMTIQEKIAGTFNSFDGTMLRLIRIQQEDSTAGRLGMESALNSFLNEMYENTEYLKTVAEGVRSSLQEMESLMSGAEATEVEYQVQKWMGSLYSVGMSQEAVNNIAGALGQIAAGQVDALTNGSGAGNLLVMAANQAGKSISEILTDGLNADETNALLQSAVNYLAGLAKSSEDSRVVQQQLASVYGVKASDLRAAVTLASDVSTDVIAKEALTYDNMIGRLNEMAGTMHLRTSLGEMMQNVWANGQYTLAGSMANNPAAYLLYKTASLLDATTGGINLPAVSVAGFGVDLETTVADLMRVGAISTGVLGSFGSMISGLSNSFSGRAMLSEMGIKEGSGLAVNIRGSGEGISASDITGGGAQTLSGSGYVGNASGSDIKDSTMQEAEDSKDKLMIEAIEEEQAHQIDYINENVLKIYELLDEVTNGKRNFNVKVSGYGLTSTVSSSALIGAQGGVGGQLNVSNGMNSGSGAIGNGGFSSGYGSSGGFSGGSGSSGSGGGGASGGSVGGSASGSASADGGGYNISRGIDLGGWTMM